MFPQWHHVVMRCCSWLNMWIYSYFFFFFYHFSYSTIFPPWRVQQHPLGLKYIWLGVTALRDSSLKGKLMISVFHNRTDGVQFRHSSCLKPPPVSFTVSLLCEVHSQPVKGTLDGLPGMMWKFCMLQFGGKLISLKLPEVSRCDSSSVSLLLRKRYQSVKTESPLERHISTTGAAELLSVQFRIY